MTVSVRSHAKINLGLHIGAPRADGFHALATVYQTLALYDVVTVTARPATVTKIRLTSNDSRVPNDNRNTAWKMIELALDGLGRAAEVEIHIEKRLPVQGGLGAGSANAVAALIGLEAELGIANEACASPPIKQKAFEGWGTDNLQPDQKPGSTADPRAPSLRLVPGARVGNPPSWHKQRLAIAAQVGSDVPLFLIGGTVLGLDRGQEVSELPDIDPTWCVVATPAIGVSTPQAFRDWDALCAEEGLTPQTSHAKLGELSRAYASAFAGDFTQGQPGAGSSGVLPHEKNLAGPQVSALVRTGISSWIQNDFERVVFPQHPSLAEIKRILVAADTPEAALHASLSGSGSALYGLYLTRGDALAACERLLDAGVESQLTRTLPRQAYWSEMLCEEGH